MNLRSFNRSLGLRVSACSNNGEVLYALGSYVIRKWNYGAGVAMTYRMNSNISMDYVISCSADGNYAIGCNVNTNKTLLRVYKSGDYGVTYGFVNLNALVSEVELNYYSIYVVTAMAMSTTMRMHMHVPNSMSKSVPISLPSQVAMPVSLAKVLVAQAKHLLAPKSLLNVP
jgi:hypothetical protein